MSLESLNQSGIQKDNPSLYQTVKELITAIDLLTGKTATLVSGVLSTPVVIKQGAGNNPQWPLLQLQWAPTFGSIRLSMFTQGLLYLSINLSWNGQQWELDDQASNGYLFFMSPASGIQFYKANAGVNPVAITLLYTLDLAGLITILGQIKFPAAQNPSADANTLDDYEEGIWTPTDVSGAGLGNFAQFSQAVYQKIGAWVNITFDFAYPVTGSGLVAAVGGLPFTVAGGSRSSVGILSANPGFPNLAALANAGTNLFTLFAQGGGGNITNAQAQNSVYVGDLRYLSTQ